MSNKSNKMSFREDSKPVRAGNRATGKTQDVRLLGWTPHAKMYAGEVLSAMYVLKTMVEKYVQQDKTSANLAYDLNKKIAKQEESLTETRILVNAKYSDIISILDIIYERDDLAQLFREAQPVRKIPHISDQEIRVLSVDKENSMYHSVLELKRRIKLEKSLEAAVKSGCKKERAEIEKLNDEQYRLRNEIIGFRISMKYLPAYEVRMLTMLCAIPGFHQMVRNNNHNWRGLDFYGIGCYDQHYAGKACKCAPCKMNGRKPMDADSEIGPWTCVKQKKGEGHTTEYLRLNNYDLQPCLKHYRMFLQSGYKDNHYTKYDDNSLDISIYGSSNFHTGTKLCEVTARVYLNKYDKQANFYDTFTDVEILRLKVSELTVETQKKILYAPSGFKSIDKIPNWDQPIDIDLQSVWTMLMLLETKKPKKTVIPVAFRLLHKTAVPYPMIIPTYLADHFSTRYSDLGAVYIDSMQGEFTYRIFPVMCSHDFTDSDAHYVQMSPCWHRARMSRNIELAVTIVRNKKTERLDLLFLDPDKAYGETVHFDYYQQIVVDNVLADIKVSYYPPALNDTTDLDNRTHWKGFKNRETFKVEYINDGHIILSPRLILIYDDMNYLVHRMILEQMDVTLPVIGQIMNITEEKGSLSFKEFIDGDSEGIVLRRDGDVDKGMPIFRIDDEVTLAPWDCKVKLYGETFVFERNAKPGCKEAAVNGVNCYIDNMLLSVLGRLWITVDKKRHYNTTPQHMVYILYYNGFSDDIIYHDQNKSKPCRCMTDAKNEARRTNTRQIHIADNRRNSDWQIIRTLKK